MSKRPKILFSFIMCCAATTASALDLNEAMNLAQRYDTTFQAAYARYLSTIEASSQSTAAILPQIDFNAFYQQGKSQIDRSGSAVSSDNNKDGYSLNLNQVIFDKSVFDNLDQGDAIVAQATVDLKSARQDTIVRVTTAYFDVLTAIETLETATAEKLAISKQLEQSKERFNVGLSAITDVKEQQASYDISVADEIIAINRLSNSREALRVIINTYPDNLEILQQKITLAVPEPMNIDAWQKKALETNFSLLSAKYGVDATQSAYDSSKGGHYPTLGLNASYGIVNADDRVFTNTFSIPASKNTDSRIVLSLDIPLYSGGFTSSAVRQKLSDLNLSKALHEQEKRKTVALARSAYLSLEADIAQVRARKQAVISTQTSLNATMAGYDAGTRTSVDVLISQRLLYSSQRDYAVARHTYITDSLELKRVAGTLTVADLEQINKWLIPRPTKQAKP